MKLIDLFEAKLKGTIDPNEVFSDVEQDVFFTLFVDFPEIVWDSSGFTDKSIPTKDLIPTQENVDGYKVGNTDALFVAERAGKFYVLDGHHRLAKALKQKTPSLECRILKLPDQKITSLKWFEDKLGMKLALKNGVVRRV